MHCLFFHRRRARGLLRFRNGLLRPIDRILGRMRTDWVQPQGTSLRQGRACDPLPSGRWVFVPVDRKPQGKDEWEQQDAAGPSRRGEAGKKK